MGISSFKLKLSTDAIVSLLGLTVVLASYLGFIPPRYAGFYCNDPHLSFVNNGDSYSLGMLFAIVLITPIIFIWYVEVIRHNIFTSKLDGLSAKYNRSVFWKCCVLVYRTYFNGIVCASVIEEFLKMTIGGLRPHFFHSCQPDYTQINCSQGFITEYTCTRELKVYHHADIFKSFPSGHAALAFYMSLFLCFYIHKQVTAFPSVYFCSVVQALLIFWAIQCSYSRMSDHRHHWWDVMTGAVIGSLCSCHAVKMFYLKWGSL